MGVLSVAGGRAGAKLLVRGSHAAFGVGTQGSLEFKVFPCMREADTRRKKENSVFCFSFDFFLGPVLLRSV